MDCPAARELLSAQMDGALPPELTGPLRAHLDTCAACRLASDELIAVDNALRSLIPAPEAAARIAGRALASISTTHLPQPAHRVSRRSALLAALAAAAAVAAAVLVLVWPSGPGAVPLLAADQVEITLARGAINILPSPTSEWQPLSLPENAIQLVGFQLQTEAAGLCEFRCASGGIVRVDEQTELQLTGPDGIALSRGRVWCAAPSTSLFTVTSAPSRPDIPPLVCACPSESEMQTATAPSEPVRVIATRGPVHVADATETVTLQPGTSVSYSTGGYGDPAPIDTAQATEWMLPLLALRGGNDREFSRQVTGVLSHLGTSKLDYVQEERLVDLGSPAAIPLVAYLRETPPGSDPPKRERAARIIAQTAPEETIPDLVELLSDPLPGVRVGAAEALQRLTGLDQGLPPPRWNDPGASRSDALSRWRAWLRRR